MSGYNPPSRYNLYKIDRKHTLITVEEVFMDFQQIKMILSKYNLSVEEMKLSGNIAVSKDGYDIADEINGIKLTR